LSTGDQIAGLSRWLDEYPPNAARDREAQLWNRVSKIGEEFGEVVKAMIGVTNQNPRKGVTHSIDDVRTELFDVAITAIAAIEHIDGNTGAAMGELAERVAAVYARAGLS
jgi:NTP pyrophosphatase (non-canonical NTP hydrolase)